MQRIESQTAWLHPPDALDLQPNVVDVWRIPLDLPAATVKRLESTLSEYEVRRAARFHFPADRRRYSAAHGSLRDILVRSLRGEPKELIFSTDSYGKPSIQGDEIQFNLSHSGDFALVAVTQGRRVGVDVECIRSEIEIERIARRFFSQSEVSELVAVPSDLRQSAFFDCWTRKEAYIKAHGLGLSLPLDSFDVSLTPNEPARLRATRPDSGEAARWSLLSLDVDPAYRAAVAVENSVLKSPKELTPSSPQGHALSSPKGQNPVFRFWDWSPSCMHVTRSITQ